MNEIILQNENGKILASSREVADKFKKKHAEVLYAIEGRTSVNRVGKEVVKHIGLLMGGYDQLSEMFIKSEYIDSMNRVQYEYFMTRDGFSLLIMGFSGKEALVWKLKYIEAFNIMEEKLKASNLLSDEERLKLQLFSKNPLEVVTAHNQLVELEVIAATTPLLKTIEEQKPKSEFHDTVHASVNSVSIGKFSGVLQKKQPFKKFGRNKLFQWLRDNDYLCECGDLKNKPTQKALSAGYMDYAEHVADKGRGKFITTYKPLITGKGQTYFVKKLLEEFE